MNILSHRLTPVVATYMFLTLCALALLLAPEAQARQRSAERYARVALVDRYPLGAREFYSQFAEPRGMLPAQGAGDASLLSEASALAGVMRSDAPPASPAFPGNEAKAVTAAGRRSGEQVAPASMSAPSPPLSRLALPIAAIGLMLFVARRRSIL